MMGGIMMLKKARLIVLVMIAMFICSSIVVAGQQNFTLVNYSGRDIYQLYCSRSDHKGWEENIIKDNILRHGKSIKVNFSNTEKGKFWDIRVVFKDGKDWKWHGVDLSTVYKMVIDGKGTAHYN